MGRLRQFAAELGGDAVGRHHVEAGARHEHDTGCFGLAIACRQPLEDLAVHQPTLEDTYLALTQEATR